VLGRLRAKYEQAVAPVGRVLADAGLSPNTMTVASLLIATASAYVYAMGMAPWGALLIVATGVFDMFDGAIARATGKTSRFGATLDHVTDRYAECFIVCGMIYGGYTPWYWGVFTLFGMLMASFTRAKAESVGGLERCTVGIAERQEKLILLIGGSGHPRRRPVPPHGGSTPALHVDPNRRKIGSVRFSCHREPSVRRNHHTLHPE
jgi:phosphatidylglycerophosphate synthase